MAKRQVTGEPRKRGHVMFIAVGGIDSDMVMMPYWDRVMKLLLLRDDLRSPITASENVGGGHICMAKAIEFDLYSIKSIIHVMCTTVPQAPPLDHDSLCDME